MAAVEPENDPDRIVERTESLIEGAPDTEPTLYEAPNPQLRKQVYNIREQTDTASDPRDDQDQFLTAV